MCMTQCKPILIQRRGLRRKNPARLRSASHSGMSVPVAAYNLAPFQLVRLLRYVTEEQYNHREHQQDQDRYWRWPYRVASHDVDHVLAYAELATAD